MCTTWEKNLDEAYLELSTDQEYLEQVDIETLREACLLLKKAKPTADHRARILIDGAPDAYVLLKSCLDASDLSNDDKVSILSHYQSRINRICACVGEKPVFSNSETNLH